MKSILMGALLCFGCDDSSQEDHHVVVKKQEQAYVAPPPAPINPFEKAALPPQYPPFHEPHWVQVGGEFKINEHWSMWTWRDDANAATCYMTIVDRNAGQMSMSCVRE
jgi:hypothetical protein